MDLTPRKETHPWWTLLRCCNPSDELHKENDGDEKTSTMSASTSLTTECSDDSSEQVIEKAGTAKQRVSFTIPVETDAIITKDTTESTNAEPTLIDSDDDDDDDDDDGDASTLDIDSKNPHALKNSDYYSLPFRTFLFYMVLRNIIGVDYLSDRVFSGRKKALMITSGVSSPHGKTKQGEVVAGSD